MSWISRGFDRTYGAAWNNLTNRGDRNRNDPRMPNYAGPGAGYGEPRDEGFTWGPNAGQRILADHPLNAEGLPEGYDGLLPHTIAPQVQAVHERRLFEQRQQMMQDAVRGARGAASLLSSFRPGGGAALESGIYSQVANLQMQRAQMTQPLDLLGDFRREQDFQARRKANRAAEQAIAIKAVGALATVATAGAGAPVAAAALAAGTGLASQQASRAGAPAGGGYDEGGGGGAGAFGPQMPQGGETQLGIDPSTGGQYGGDYNVQAAPDIGGGGGGSAMGAPGGGGYQATLQPEAGGGGGAGAQGGGPGGQRGAGGGQQERGMGAGGGVPGSDGVFDPQAYAADSMRQPVMQHPIVRLVAADTAVNMMEESGLIPALSYAADRALAMRLAV